MKYTWKNLISFVLVGAMALTLTACGQSNSSQSSDESQDGTTQPSSASQTFSDNAFAPDASAPSDTSAIRHRPRLNFF